MVSSYLPILTLLSLSHHAIAQTTDTITDAAIGTMLPDLGIFQMISPTTHASNMPVGVYNSFQASAYDFFQSYTAADPFDINKALSSAVLALPAGQRPSLARAIPAFATQLASYPTALLASPSPFLKNMASAIAPFGASASSGVMSQATGILMGYESIASVDVLSKTPAAKVTPGMSVSGQAGPTAAAGGSSSAAAPAAGSTGASGSAPASATSSGAGAAAATANVQLMVNAAAAAAGLVGMALM